MSIWSKLDVIVVKPDITSGRQPSIKKLIDGETQLWGEVKINIKEINNTLDVGVNIRQDGRDAHYQLGYLLGEIMDNFTVLEATMEIRYV